REASHEAVAETRTHLPVVTAVPGEAAPADDERLVIGADDGHAAVGERFGEASHELAGVVRHAEAIVPWAIVELEKEEQLGSGAHGGLALDERVRAVVRFAEIADVRRRGEDAEIAVAARVLRRTARDVRLAPRTGDALEH